MKGQDESQLKEARRVQIESAIAPLEGTRYHAIAREVLERLPNGWDLYREYVLEISKSPKPGIYAGALRLEDGETSPDDLCGEQVWVVTLYHQQLFDLSDTAIKWVIAHELGHVASGLPCGSLSIGGLGYARTSENVYRAITEGERELHEVDADAIARALSFREEEQVWVKEVKEQGKSRERR